VTLPFDQFGDHQRRADEDYIGDLPQDRRIEKRPKVQRIPSGRVRPDRPADRSSTYRATSVPVILVTTGALTHVMTVSAAPDGFGVTGARPYVGYPFRQDAAILKAARASKAGAQATGPLHIVGVFKNVTEAQIRNHIGNADIAILPFQFGYLAHDEIQSIQVAYLTRLSDETAIRRAITELRLRLADPQVAPTVERLAKRRAGMLL
jgi:hypothetical protein